MDIQLTIAQIGTSTGTVTFNLYDPTAPTVIVATQSVTLPITNTLTVVFPNLQDQTYICRSFLGGTQIGSDFYAYPGQVNSATVRDDYFAVQGVDSGFTSDNITYNNTSFVGWKFSIEQKGIGTLQPGVDINILSGGGFQFINNYTIQPGEEFIFHFQPQTTAVSSGASSNPGLKFKDIKIITADTTILTSDDIGKTIIVQGSTGNTPQITLPDPTTVVDNILTCIQSNGGSHIMCSIIATTQFKWLGSTPSTLYLAQNEEIWIYKNGTTWYVAHSDGNFKTVGRIEESFDGPAMNTLLLNGGTYSKSLYPRLYEYITTKLNSNLITTESNWAFKDASTLIYTNIGKFTVDNSTYFRVPLIMEVWDLSGNMVCGGFTRAMGTPNTGLGISLIGNTTYGRILYDKVGKFWADITGKTIYKSGGSNSIIALGIPASGTGGVTSDTDHSAGGNNIVSNVPLIGKRLTGVNTYTVNSDTAPGHIGVFKTIRY